jgi:hypothetical protein
VPGGERRAGAVRVDPAPSVALSDLTGVHGLRRRADPPLRRVSVATAALVCFAAQRAAHRCRPRFNPWPETLDWGPAGELRCPAPPQLLAVGSALPPAACMHPAPPDRDPTRQIQSSRPTTRMRLAPLDRDLTSQI